jgi:hypothetical protein
MFSPFLAAFRATTSLYDTSLLNQTFEEFAEVGKPPR